MWIHLWDQDVQDSCWDTKPSLILTRVSQQTLWGWPKQTQHSLPPKCSLSLDCLVFCTKNSCPGKTEVFLRKFSQFYLPIQQNNDWTNLLALLPHWMWSTGILERITLRSQCSHAEFIIYSPEARRGRKKKTCDLLTLWSSEVFVNHNFPDMKDLLRRAEK